MNKQDKKYINEITNQLNKSKVNCTDCNATIFKKDAFSYRYLWYCNNCVINIAAPSSISIEWTGDGTSGDKWCE